MPTKPPTHAGLLRHSGGRSPRRLGDVLYNRKRRSDPALGIEDEIVSSGRWKALRRDVLRREPLCRACARAGRTALATQLDHVVPVRDAPHLAFVVDNLEPSCVPCHAAKSGRERAARARARRAME